MGYGTDIDHAEVVPDSNPSAKTRSLNVMATLTLPTSGEY